MVFIRLKKVSGKQYAYLVQNTWSAKGPRQNVQRYLGRYIELAATPLKATPGAVTDAGKLVATELKARGFSERLTLGKLKVSLTACTVREAGRRVVLGLNGGFLCDHTLRKLLHFQPVVDVTPGYSYARAYSDAGIRISREQFVSLYRKVYRGQVQPQAAHADE